MTRPRVGLVLSGGGARGAYEVGVLSVLAPLLESRGERPEVLVGTSAGAINAVLLAAHADLPFPAAVEAVATMWRTTRYEDVLGPLISPAELRRVLLYGLELIGLPGASVPSLLDASPQARTLREVVDFDRLARNVSSRRVATVAVVATAYHSGRSVVFQHGGPAPPNDEVRAIDYVPTRIGEAHVLASAAIPVLFPAVEVSRPARAAGWYGDGGTRLNTPLKPALALGADRLVVIGLNAITGRGRDGGRARPDIFAGAAQMLQSGLADQLANDVATLVTVNRLLDGRATNGPYRHIPYMFVAPQGVDSVGRLAVEIHARHFSGVGGLLRCRDLNLLGRVLDVGRNPQRGELLSYLLFAREFFDAMIERGRADARRWLDGTPDGDPWRCDDLPDAAPATRRSRT
ncbi:MAG: patatin [Chloroflexi bacterium]|nr:MAG: patatin [Chloroflexota bacterium]